ncbi:MAG: cation transporter [Pseudonocardiales bacterium]|nr:cation transporter [Pseudonocardiales bacterium]
MRTAQAQSRAEGKQRDSGGGESTLTVVVALAANAPIAVMKAMAGLLTGSAAMLAEAAHSVADTTTEGLLLAALRQSERPADRQHPFGYGKVRFFWSLIAAVSIFVTGGVFSGFEGVRTILGSGEDQTLAWVAFLVLGLSFLMEGASWLKAVRQIRREQSDEGQQLLEYLRLPDDPTVKTVFLVERACIRIDDELRREFTDLDEIFIEPVPRADPALRARVVNRYGGALHDLRPDSAPPVP